MNKTGVFKTELEFILNEDIRNFAAAAIEHLPDYFFSVAASSTGKFHPPYALGTGGLVRHTKAAVRFAHHLLNLEHMKNIFDERTRDLIIVALILHDGWKHGENGGRYTTFDHPIVSANWVRDSKGFGNLIPQEDADLIAMCISSHMGEWNTDKRSSIVLPKPITDAQKFVHMCDYLASRKDIIITFENDNNFEDAEPEPPKLEEYTLGFGKYRGEKLVTVWDKDPNYVKWLCSTGIKNKLLESMVEEVMKNR